MTTATIDISYQWILWVTIIIVANNICFYIVVAYHIEALRGGACDIAISL